MSRSTRGVVLRRSLLLLIAAVLAAAAWWAVAGGVFGGSGRPTRLPRSTSRYLNTAFDVAYIGREACAKCHVDEHASYLRTSHSRAFRRVDAKREPRSGRFRHEASGLNYRILNDGRRLVFREELLLEDGTQVPLAEHEAHWRAGSGSNSRSYVLPIDGFFVEAPVTWYAAKGAWGISPGYDRPVHEGFARNITSECLFCHVGRTEALGGSTHRLRVQEDAIGCERCHGPGALHAAKWADGREPTGEKDDTIVNPLDLAPEAQLDLCGQCHMDHTLSVPVRGRRMEGWRPGLPMKEFRTTYRLDSTNRRMSVVGHVDQLRQSRCFQASGDMSCITCHDPHFVPDESEARAYFRDRCLSCHAVEACGVGHTDPRRTAEADDCMACHMPRSPTDIPHFAFTHHRVGLHQAPSTPPSADEIHELVPSGSVEHLPPADRERNLGLAYLLLMNRRPDDPSVTSVANSVQDAYMERGRSLLERARERGAGDGILESSLAFVQHRKGDVLGALAHARAALAEGRRLPPVARVRALEMVAVAHGARQEHKEAIQALQELVKLRRDAHDWGRLAEAQYALGDQAAALASAKKAVEIGPHRWETQEFLARAYELVGDAAATARHRRIAERLKAVAKAR